MTRGTLVELARRTLGHAKAGTVPLAGNVGRVPASNYYDHDRWDHELDAIFRRLPLVLGFSCELAGANRYKAIEVAGVPVVLVRDGDGVLRSFVNACSHRGAIVVPEGDGTARRFTCPYHAWSYGLDGALVGVLDRDEFGEIDLDRLGLTPLPVAERAGIVFGAVSPNATLDIDTFLCGYAALLGELRLDACTYVGRQTVAGPNWKIAYDGYLDFYHLPILHKDSFGPRISNKAIYDAWGPHQRVTSPDRRLLALDDIPSDEWTLDSLTDGVWTIFPHCSIAAFDVEVSGDGGRIYMVSTLFPGSEPGTSYTVQNFLAAFDVGAEHEEAIAAQQAFLLRVVRDEDYFTGNGIQRALETGAKDEVLFGRNEAGGQRFHRWVDRILAADSDDDLTRLFEQAEIVFSH